MKLIQAFREKLKLFNAQSKNSRTKKRIMQQERDSFVFITTSEAAVARLKQATEFLNLEPRFYSSLRLFLEEDRIRPRTLLVDLRGIPPEEQSLLSKMRKIRPKTQIVGLIEKVEDKSPDWYLQHFMTTAMLSSFVLEFFLFQRNYCEYFEISPTDLFPDTMVYFNAYHFLPLNQKYLPLIHENFKLTEKKHRRVDVLKALYIFRGDSSAYVQYIEKYFDQFSVGLRKRAKSRAYQLLVEWRDLLYSYILEMREVESCSTTRPDFAIWMNELLNYFSTAKDPWELMFELCRLSCFDFDRSLMEVVVACYLSRNLGEDEAEKIIDLRLLLTLCRFRVDSLLFKRWHLMQPLSPEEKTQWNAFPDTLMEYKISPEFPPDVLGNVSVYQKQFLQETEKEVKDGRLVYTYIGEIIVATMQRSPTEDYKKEELLESIIVKCKSDGILPEAWLEELRQFLKK